MDEVQRLALIVEAVRYCRRVSSMGMPSSSYSKALREPVYFLWDCRHGGRKDTLAKYRSRDTLGMRRGRGDLQLDHAVPFKYLQQRLLSLADPTVDTVRDVLNEYGVFVLITKEEDERLNRAGYRHEMPTEWDGRDPLARYKALGIELVENRAEDSTS